MKTKLKTIIQTTYMKVRYQWWKAKIFASPNDSRISKLVRDQIFHEDLMKATITLLDRLGPEDAKADHNPYKFIGVLKTDWTDAKPAVKENDSVSE